MNTPDARSPSSHSHFGSKEDMVRLLNKSGLRIGYGFISFEDDSSEEMASEKDNRNTGPKDASAVTAVLLPFAEKRGKSFIKYPTDATTVDMTKLAKCRPILKALKDISPNLSFNKSVLKGTLGSIGESTAALIAAQRAISL